MPEEPGIGWMALFLPDGTTETASPIRLENAQVYFDPGDRVGFLAGPARRTTGLIAKLNPKRARVRCGDAAWSMPYARLNPRRGSGAELPGD